MQLLMLANYFCHSETVYIPFVIRVSMILARCVQILFYNKLNELFNLNIQLLQNEHLMDLICNQQFPPVKHIHKVIEQDCESIYSLLADGKHIEAITWVKHYFGNHPCKQSIETVISNLNTLLDSCKVISNCEEVVLAIKGNISLFSELLENFNGLQRITMLNIIGYNHVLYLVNATTSDDLVHYLKCSGLYTRSNIKE